MLTLIYIFPHTSQRPSPSLPPLSLSLSLSLIIYIYIYSVNLCTWTGFNTPSVIKRNLTYLKWKFSFSLTGCHDKAKELTLPYYFIHSWREDSFPRLIVLCEMLRPGFQLGSPCTFPRTITITTILLMNKLNVQLKMLANKINIYQTSLPKTNALQL